MPYHKSVIYIHSTIKSKVFLKEPHTFISSASKTITSFYCLQTLFLCILKYMYLKYILCVYIFTPLIFALVYVGCSPVLTKYHRPVVSKQQELILHSSGGWKSRAGVSARPDFSLFPPMAEGSEVILLEPS